MLTRKIRSATHTLVVIGKYANSLHPGREEIGERNWQWWEINQSIAEGKKLVAVKIDASNASPTPLLGTGATWAMSFTVSAIEEAIDAA